jgi:nicotinate phosphoribosyltransferase
MMWEILALKIVNTLYLYHYARKARLSGSEFNGVMTRTIARLYDDVEIFRANPEVTFSEFGTRRAASTDIHRMVLQILSEELPEQCVGTSNVMLARELGQNNPRGTNAHELRMIPMALVDDPEEIIATMYRIDREWMAHFPELAILLADTCGTSFYLKHAPEDIIRGHVGCRLDSKDPRIAIPEYVEWLIRNGQDPMTKLAIPSDGLDARECVDIARKCAQRVGKLTFGVGTNITNNTKGTLPKAREQFGPFGSFSVVIKPDMVRRPSGLWMSTVKLSDNPEKAMGDPERVALFKKTFGMEGMEAHSVSV